VPRPGKPPADFFRLPFPNDIRATGGVLDMSDFPRPGPTPLGVDLVQLYVDSWVADFDGFGSMSSVTFRFSAPLDWDTAAGSDSVYFSDVTEGAPSGLRWEWQWGPGRIKYACDQRLTVNIARSVGLVPGHTYAVYLTTTILSEPAGTAPVQDPDLVAVLAATAPAGDQALLDAWTAYAPFRRYLGERQIAPERIANAAVFTVQDAPGHMRRLAQSVATEPPPVLSELTLCDAGVTSPCDAGASAEPGRLACPAADPAFHEIHGKLTVPIYQNGTPPYETPAAGGGIREPGGVPERVRTEEVCFALTVPKAAAAPASGWPLVVYHHGTGGSMRSFISDGTAGALAGGALPAAALSFEAVEHGARRGGSQKKPDDLVFNPLNPRAARDNFLQGAVDILQALRVAALTVDVPPAVTGVKFDPAKVVFFGHSQGSTSGELALAFATGVEAAVLSGAGAYLTASLLDKTSPVDIGAGMQFLVGEPLSDAHPVMTIFQSFFERSDPIVYNPLLLRAPPARVGSKHLYMSWGTGDTYTPMRTLQANAQSLGLTPVGPVLEQVSDATPLGRPVTANVKAGDDRQRTAAVFQYAPSGYDGHFVTQRNAGARSDWMAFVQSYLATGTPTVP
jgi:predicted esterase